MNNSLPTPGSPLEDESFFLFYAHDSEEELNEQLGLTNREFIFFGWDYNSYLFIQFSDSLADALVQQSG